MSNSQTDVREIARAAVKSALAKGAKRSRRQRQPPAQRQRGLARRQGREDRGGHHARAVVAALRGRPLLGRLVVRPAAARRSRPSSRDSIAMTRVLTEDPFRTLPDPALYKGQAKADLQLEDPAYTTVTPEQRRTAAQQMEQAARAVKGAEAILSVTTGFQDSAQRDVPRRLERLRGPPCRHHVLRLGGGQRQGPRRPPARGLRLRRRTLPRPGAAGGRDRQARGRARAVAPRLEEGRLRRDDARARQPRRRPADQRAARPAVRLGPAAEALVPRGQGRPAARQPAVRRGRRPADPEGLRLAALGRRGAGGEANADLREGRVAQLLPRHLLREEAQARPTTGGPSNAAWTLGRSRRPRS